MEKCILSKVNFNFLEMSSTTDKMFAIRHQSVIVLRQKVC